MSTINLTNPTQVTLIDNTTIKVTNLTTTSKIYDTYLNNLSIGYWETFDTNKFAEVGTITYQSLNNINGDGVPPLLPVSAGTYYDYSTAYGTLTLETFYERPFSSYTINNERFSIGIPSINLSAAKFSSFTSGGTVLNVQTTIGGSNPLQKFPSSGKILLNKEVISYTGKTNTTLTGITRAQDGTVQVTHNSGDYLRTISV
jgi:hypothetical protein